MSNVQNAIEQAASRFALEVVSLLRHAKLSDILDLTGKRIESGPAASPGGARRGRRPEGVSGVSDGHGAGPAASRRGGRRAAGRKRSREEVTRLGDRILQFLGGTRQDVGVSAIGEALKVPTTELGLPLSKLRHDGKVKTHGQKRSTVYRLA